MSEVTQDRLFKCVVGGIMAVGVLAFALFMFNQTWGRLIKMQSDISAIRAIAEEFKAGK
jgi:ribonucleotide reductase beta subunit family protein with ferritin-like domain